MKRFFSLDTQTSGRGARRQDQGTIVIPRLRRAVARVEELPAR